MIKITVVFSAIIVAVLSACDNPKPVANFDRKRYAGLWNVHTVSGKPLLPTNPCFTLDFSGDTKYLMNISYKDNKLDTFVVDFIPPIFPDLTYTVLDTDYETYCTIHACYAGAESGVVAVLLRSPTPDARLLTDKLDAAQKTLSSPLNPRVDVDFTTC
nr:unnamed protein product [Callosobruchus analis]